VKKRIINGRVLLGSILVAVLMLAGAALFIWMLQAQPGQAAQGAPAAMTVIPAPSQTPAVQNNLFFTPTPSLAAPSVGGGRFAPGVYVQITGTEGEGLRLRTAPGTSSEVRFLAFDAEVFKVIDGTKMADGYTWWYLEAPYDQTRSGWAAQDFLSLVVLEPEE